MFGSFRTDFELSPPKSTLSAGSHVPTLTNAMALQGGVIGENHGWGITNICIYACFFMYMGWMGWSVFKWRAMCVKINQPISQSIKPIHRFINQSLNQPINQAINQSINQSMNQSINQSINQINQSIIQSINQSNQSNQSINQINK